MGRSIAAALGALLLLLTYCVGSSAAELREAAFSAGGEEQRVSLPHTWAPGLRSGSAAYRLEFALPEAPQELWALRIDRLSGGHRVYLNGRLIHELGDSGAGSVRLRPLPFYLPLAPNLLRAGTNELRLETQFATRGGLSPVLIGPDDELLPGWVRDRGWDTELPQGLNIAGATLAGLMLLVWWRRPQERATGLFGLLWLLASLRNHDYFVAVSPLSAAFSDWLYFCVHVLTVSLLGLFAVALSGQAWPRLRRACLASLLLLPPLSLAAWSQDALPLLRLLAYPPLVLLCGAAALVLWPLLKRQRGAALALLLAGAAVLAGTGAHDYGYLHGWLPITDFYWVPFVQPFVMASYGAMLLDRLVQALTRSEELAEANAAKSRFLAVATHDLQQPVAAIGLLVGLAAEQLGPHPLLAKAMQAVTGLEGLLHRLLDTSRLNAAPVMPALRPVPLQAIFDAVALHEQPAAQARGLRLRLRPTQAVVLSDPLLLEQILRNLVANALRYTERGGVLVAVRRRGAGLAVQVWDTGRGIAPEHRQQIFEEFVQPGHDPQGPNRGGVGLGLAIVQRSVASLGHGLRLHSRVGRGSCFSVELARAPG